MTSAALALQVLEEKFDAFRKEVHSLGQAKVQALRERAASLERAAPRFSPQIQPQRSRIEAAWERLDGAVKVRTQVRGGSQGAGTSVPSAWTRQPHQLCV